MKTLARIVHRVSYAMHLVSGTLLVAMMVVVLADIISRTTFGASGGAVDLTFRGGVELVSYGLLFMVLFALPYSVTRSQVIVDLFTENLSERVISILAGIYTFGFGLLGVGMSIRFIEAVGRVAESGETTQDLLIPLTWMYGLTAFATVMLALRGLLMGLQQALESGESA